MRYGIPNRVTMKVEFEGGFTIEHEIRGITRWEANVSREFDHATLAFAGPAIGTIIVEGVVDVRATMDTPTPERLPAPKSRRITAGRKGLPPPVDEKGK